MKTSKTKTTGSLIAVAVVSLIMGGGVANAKDTVTLRLLTSWDPSVNPGVKYGAGQFVQNVKMLSKGHIKIAQFGPEAVAAFKQFPALQNGVFDMLFTHPAYHADAIRIGMGMDVVNGSAAVRRECGLTNLIAKAYAKKTGVNYFAVFPSGFGYELFTTKKPKDQAKALAGFRIRGTQFYDPVINGLGASPVKIPTPETYTAVQRGLLDGAFTGGGAREAVKGSWPEVFKYQIKPDLGEVNYILLFNAKSWNKLSPKDQQILQKAAEEAQPVAAKMMVAITNKYETILRKKVPALQLSPAVRKEYQSDFFHGIIAKFVLPNKAYGARVAHALTCVGQKSD